MWAAIFAGLLGLLAVASLLVSSQAFAASQSGPRAGQALLLTVRVDGRTLPHPLLFRKKSGSILVPAATAKALGLAKPHQVLLKSITSSFKLDVHKLSINLHIPPRRLQATKIHYAQPASPTAGQALQGSGVSAIFGYSAAAGHTGRGWWHSGVYHASVGKGRTTCRTAYLNSPTGRSWRRLGTKCLFDWPDRMLSMSVGDAVAGGRGITAPVRFGGIHLGTDFGLQPTFIPLPESRISGSARVPSTLELYIDQRLAMRKHVSPGPFAIQNIPLHTGAGRLRATLISPTGERQVVSSSEFYASPSLLAPGLERWSFNAGKLRYGFGSSRDRYGRAFASGHLRHGMSNALTLGSGFQVAPGLKLLSGGASVRLAHFAALEFQGALSRSAAGHHGTMLRARVSHQGPHFSISASASRTLDGYRSLASARGYRVPSSTERFSVGFPISSDVSFTASAYLRHYESRHTMRFQRAGLDVRVGQGQLAFSAMRFGSRHWLFSALLTIPFGTRSDVTAFAGSHGSQRVEVQENPPAGPGVGYRASLSRRRGGRIAGRGSVRLQDDAGELDLRARHFAGRMAASARLAGSILFSGAGVHLARRRPGSYALVSVGAPGVPVYHDGQRAAVTGKDGQAVVSGLRPYQENRLYIRPDDVPLSDQAGDLSRSVKPGRNQIIDVSMRLQETSYVSGTLQLAPGKAVPPGAELKISGVSKTSIVGRRGQIFFQAPAGHRQVKLTATWGSHSCHARATVHGRNTVFKLGALHCQEIKK